MLRTLQQASSLSHRPVPTSSSSYDPLLSQHQPRAKLRSTRRWMVTRRVSARRNIRTRNIISIQNQAHLNPVHNMQHLTDRRNRLDSSAGTTAAKAASSQPTAISAAAAASKAKLRKRRRARDVVDNSLVPRQKRVIRIADGASGRRPLVTMLLCS